MDAGLNLEFRSADPAPDKDGDSGANLERRGLIFIVLVCSCAGFVVLIV